MLSPQLFTNRRAYGDFVINAFTKLATEPCNVYIAAAFFTDPDTILDFVKKGCRVRLIVRLGYPTSPVALERVIKTSGVEVRYFTDRSFHPKLYIFGDNVALVGSANLTNAAIRTNQEVMVAIERDDHRFADLAGLFNEYWQDAKVLAEDILGSYNEVYDRHKELASNLAKFEDDIEERLGRVVASNIERGLRRQSQEAIFLEDFRKSYQECVNAFNTVRSVYESVGIRKVDESKLPLRLEIDSFISFVRETYAQQDKWMESPLQTGEDQRTFIREFVEKWRRTEWPFLETDLVKSLYPKLQAVFVSSDSVRAFDDETLFTALCAVHSFRERLRFFEGGLPTLKRQFFQVNDATMIRESLAYLLFGKASVEERMSRLIFDPKYKLKEFGQANVQELIGWCNKEELPVVNGRTTKVLRFFGFDVKQL